MAASWPTTPPHPGHQEVQQRSALLPTGRYDGQQPLGEPTARFAVRPKAALAPQHGRAQRPLRHVVRRLDTLDPREGPQRRLTLFMRLADHSPALVYFPTRAGGRAA